MCTQEAVSWKGGGGGGGGGEHVPLAPPPKWNLPWYDTYKTHFVIKLFTAEYCRGLLV